METELAALGLEQDLAELAVWAPGSAMARALESVTVQGWVTASLRTPRPSGRARGQSRRGRKTPEGPCIDCRLEMTRAQRT